MKYPLYLIFFVVRITVMAEYDGVWKQLSPSTEAIHSRLMKAAEEQNETHHDNTPTAELLLHNQTSDHKAMAATPSLGIDAFRTRDESTAHNKAKVTIAVTETAITSEVGNLLAKRKPHLFNHAEAHISAMKTAKQPSLPQISNYEEPVLSPEVDVFELRINGTATQIKHIDLSRRDEKESSLPAALLSSGLGTTGFAAASPASSTNVEQDVSRTASPHPSIKNNSKGPITAEEQASTTTSDYFFLKSPETVNPPNGSAENLTEKEEVSQVRGSTEDLRVLASLYKVVGPGSSENGKQLMLTVSPITSIMSTTVSHKARISYTSSFKSMKEITNRRNTHSSPSVFKDFTDSSSFTGGTKTLDISLNESKTKTTKMLEKVTSTIREMFFATESSSVSLSTSKSSLGPKPEVSGGNEEETQPSAIFTGNTTAVSMTQRSTIEMLLQKTHDTFKIKKVTEVEDEVLQLQTLNSLLSNISTINSKSDFPFKQSNSLNQTLPQTSRNTVILTSHAGAHTTAPSLRQGVATSFFENNEHFPGTKDEQKAFFSQAPFLQTLTEGASVTNSLLGKRTEGVHENFQEPPARLTTAPMTIIRHLTATTLQGLQHHLLGTSSTNDNTTSGLPVKFHTKSPGTTNSNSVGSDGHNLSSVGLDSKDLMSKASDNKEDNRKTSKCYKCLTKTIMYPRLTHHPLVADAKMRSTPYIQSTSESIPHASKQNPKTYSTLTTLFFQSLPDKSKSGISFSITKNGFLDINPHTLKNIFNIGIGESTEKNDASLEIFSSPTPKLNPNMFTHFENNKAVLPTNSVFSEINSNVLQKQYDGITPDKNFSLVYVTGHDFPVTQASAESRISHDPPKLEFKDQQKLLVTPGSAFAALSDINEPLNYPEKAVTTFISEMIDGNENKTIMSNAHDFALNNYIFSHGQISLFSPDTIKEPPKEIPEMKDISVKTTHSPDTSHSAGTQAMTRTSKEEKHVSVTYSMLHGRISDPQTNLFSTHVLDNVLLPDAIAATGVPTRSAPYVDVVTNHSMMLQTLNSQDLDLPHRGTNLDNLKQNYSNKDKIQTSNDPFTIPSLRQEKAVTKNKPGGKFTFHDIQGIVSTSPVPNNLGKTGTLLPFHSSVRLEPSGTLANSAQPVISHEIKSHLSFHDFLVLTTVPARSDLNLKDEAKNQNSPKGFATTKHRTVLNELQQATSPRLPTTTKKLSKLSELSFFTNFVHPDNKSEHILPTPRSPLNQSVEIMNKKKTVYDLTTMPATLSLVFYTMKVQPALDITISPLPVGNINLIKVNSNVGTSTMEHHNSESRSSSAPLNASFEEFIKAFSGALQSSLVPKVSNLQLNTNVPAKEHFSGSTSDHITLPNLREDRSVTSAYLDFRAEQTAAETGLMHRETQQNFTLESTEFHAIENLTSMKNSTADPRLHFPKPLKSRNRSEPDFRKERTRQILPNIFLSGLAVLSDDICGTGNYTAQMNLNLERELTPGDSIPAHGNLHVVINIKTNNSLINLEIESCCLSPFAQPDDFNTTCCVFSRLPLGSRDIRLHPRQLSKRASFTISLFQMINYSTAYLHCDLSICLKNHTHCEQVCCSESRAMTCTEKSLKWNFYGHSFCTKQCLLHRKLYAGKKAMLRSSGNRISFGPMLKRMNDSSNEHFIDSTASKTITVLLGSVLGSLLLTYILVLVWLVYRQRAKKHFSSSPNGLCNLLYTDIWVIP